MSDNEDNIFDTDSDNEIDDELEEKDSTPIISKKTNLTKVIVDDDDDDIDEENEDNDSDYEDNLVDENEIDNLDDDDDEGKEDIEYVKEKSSTNITDTDDISMLQDNDTDIQQQLPNEKYEDDEEDEQFDEDYLQKFNTNIKENFVDEFHPETYVHNYEEIAASVNVVRDKNNIIVDPLHRTIPILTKYEKTRILGQRAKQIDEGAKPYVTVPVSCPILLKTSSNNLVSYATL